MLKEIRILWLAISIAIISVIGLLPYHLLLPYLWWRYIHITSAALYSGIVVISALLEWQVSSQLQSSYLHRQLFLSYNELVASMDKILITSMVSLLLVSAIALLNYRGLSLWNMNEWPMWTMISFLLLSGTGALWAFADVRTQNEIKVLSVRLFTDKMKTTDESQLNRLLAIRHYINVFSVCTIPILYYLMVFKPS